MRSRFSILGSACALLRCADRSRCRGVNKALIPQVKGTGQCSSSAPTWLPVGYFWAFNRSGCQCQISLPEVQRLWRRAGNWEPLYYGNLSHGGTMKNLPPLLSLVYLRVNLAHLNAWHPDSCQFVQTSEYCESGSNHSCCLLPVKCPTGAEV